MLTGFNAAELYGDWDEEVLASVAEVAETERRPEKRKFQDDSPPCFFASEVETVRLLIHVHISLRSL